MCFDLLCSSMCFDPLLLSSFDHLLVELRSSISLFVELRSSLLAFITASHCSIITARGKYCMVVVMTLVLEQQHYREGEKVVMGKEPVVELEYDKVVEKLVLVDMEKVMILVFLVDYWSIWRAAFLSALVGSEVAYSAAQATVATLSEAYETTKNHRSFPRNTSLQGNDGKMLSDPEIINLIRGKKLSEKMIQRFKAILNAAEGPVNDAERRQIREGPVKIWLDDLKDAIYEADDFLDEIATKAATKKDQGNFLTRFKKERKKVTRMEDVIGRLESIVNQKDTLGLKEIPMENMSWRTLTVVLFEGWMLDFKPLPTEVVKAVDLQLVSKSIKETDESQISRNLEAQHRYLVWRAEKDPGQSVLKKLIGETLAKVDQI
ncbi:hypothetical protein Ahy_B07g088610 isoform B [Arachis hypogaea]|uniref:Disease resistance N-terminal domain-containing protein n=1 Tax=Arachis hypogaea TaxID=3818 RepID=A0A444YF06_ARAHY|nr:hypothetical protein Ahy_B07g088610 isoform B [Arachis hypogaea]